MPYQCAPAAVLAKRAAKPAEPSIKNMRRLSKNCRKMNMSDNQDHPTKVSEHGFNPAGPRADAGKPELPALYRQKLIISGQELFPVVDELLSRSLRVVFTVTGMSMWPLIRHGHDSVRLVALHKPPRRGDIVLYKTPFPQSKYILHRVYKVTGETMVTLGDGCLEPDPAAQVPWVIGRVEVIIRKNGRELSCDGLLLRAYAWFWALALPVRRHLFKLLMAAGKALRKLGLR